MMTDVHSVTWDLCSGQPVSPIGHCVLPVPSADHSSSVVDCSLWLLRDEASSVMRVRCLRLTVTVHYS